MLRRRKFWHRRGGIVHHSGVQIDPDALPDDPAALQQMLRELYAENDKLRLLIQRLMRHQFGRRSEQLTADQLQFGLEDRSRPSPSTGGAGRRRGAGGRQPPSRAPRPAAITAHCRRICRATRW